MAFSSVSYLREYKHTRLSKVLVSNGFNNIYNGLVKEIISYALHNPQEIMIMRYSSESSQTREKEADVETALDPEAIEDVGLRRGSEFKIKHRHTDVTGDHECRRLTGSEAQTETNTTLHITIN